MKEKKSFVIFKKSIFNGIHLGEIAYGDSDSSVDIKYGDNTTLIIKNEIVCSKYLEILYTEGNPSVIVDDEGKVLSVPMEEIVENEEYAFCIFDTTFAFDAGGIDSFLTYNIVCTFVGTGDKLKEYIENCLMYME